MKRLACALLLLLVVAMASGAVWAADGPAAKEFVWHADLAMPSGTGMARVILPPEALGHLQSRDARDVRVFNAAGESVAFAFSMQHSAMPAQAPVSTQAYVAYPLFAAAKGERAAKGAVQVHVDSLGSPGSVWVRLGDAAPSSAAALTAQPLQSALFDVRAEKQNIEALSLQARLPANALIHFSLASSTDLAQWVPVPLRGPLFRFDGAGAPESSVLELVRPQAVDGRYLRLSWDGHQDVQISSLTGIVAKAAAAPARVRLALASGVQEGASSLNWPLGFATPLAALQLSTSRNNTLVPIRILGRDDIAQPWRLLAQSVIYRLDASGKESVNLPVALGHASVRWLRVEALNGMSLASQEILAHAEFEPVELVVLASGKSSFELVVGRPGTGLAAIDASVLALAMKGLVSDLPLATVSNVRVTPGVSSGSGLTRWLPAGIEQKSLVLWGVLLAGVLVLAGVAFGLLRQVSGGTAK